MRIFCFSFAIYLAVLCVQPCRGLTAVIACLDNERSVVSDCETRSGRGSADEDCSPFCGCSCSADTVAILPVKIGTGARNGTYNAAVNYAEYSSPNLSARKQVIWQPPKSSV